MRLHSMERLSANWWNNAIAQYGEIVCKLVEQCDCTVWRDCLQIGGTMRLHSMERLSANWWNNAIAL